MLVSANELYIKPFVSVFPTCVGMFLTSFPAGNFEKCFPHVCGDVSNFIPSRPVTTAVFPTCVGMFLNPRFSIPKFSRFPHVCGDVSCLMQKRKGRIAFSPRVWGCFGYPQNHPSTALVFPTSVGFLFLFGEMSNMEYTNREEGEKKEDTAVWHFR